MNRLNNSKKISLFIVFMLLSVLLIGMSTWLIYSVNKKRADVEAIVEEIGIISDVELDLNNCLDLWMQEDAMSFQEAASELTSTDYYLADYVSLEGLSSKLDDLKKGVKTSRVLLGSESFYHELQDISAYCQAQKKKRRQDLGILSVELGGYWVYTHIVTVVACVLFVILAWLLFRSIGTRQNISELRHQNNLFKNNLTDCLMVGDNEGIITEINNVAVSLFGYTSEELIGMSVEKLYANKEEFIQVKKSLDETGIFQGEIYNRSKSGDSFEVFLSANIVYDEEGNVVGSMGISRDISDQKKQEKRYEYIVDNAGDVIYTTDESGRVTYVNNSIEALLGYNKREIIGKSFHALIHPDSIGLVQDHYDRQFKNSIEDSFLEFKMMRRDGTPIWVGQSVRTSFDPIDPKRINGFLGILRDLNDAKKATLKLQESELKYRELFENTKGLIQSIDVEGRILFANEAWKQLLGYSDSDLQQMWIDDILTDKSKEDGNRLLNEIMKEATDLGTREERLTMVSKSGEEFILKGTISLRFRDNVISELQLFLRDVTAQEKAEQALARSEANFQLISNSINDVFFLYNLVEKKYDYISENCRSILGISQGFFYKGGNFSEKVLNQEEKEAYEETMSKVMQGLTGGYEYKIVVDGEDRWIDEEWFPIIDDREEVVGISGVCRDMTEMKEAYTLIFEKNYEIEQSIVYAKHIQESTLPTDEEMKTILPKSFVFYQAKDVLSGDLYVVDIIKYKGIEMPTFVVGDCTGHGVPGGVLSLLCSGLLRESLTNKDISSPSEALDFVRQKLIGLFRSNPNKYILDGMDAAFCVLNKPDRELYFAGANLSCYIFRNDEVLEYKGDKQHIGYSSDMEPFVHFSIDLEDGDRIYLTTDGFVDQFGGPKNKKFFRKRFMGLIQDIQGFSMEEQEVRIRAAFNDWKGNTDQTDDIVVMGVEIDL